MTTVTKEHDAPTVDATADRLPIDVESIHDGLAHALMLPLATTTREDINASVQQVLGHLNVLMAEELGYDSDADVRGLFRQAYALLDLSRRPDEETAVFEVFTYLGDTVRVAMRFLDKFEASLRAPAQGPT
ncbi:hypothetical protein [Streptomyces laculatispora]|uniref:hypothetical protein n=1 Tax=Streptomyces laculatispora TaxID=887464 RepID=UPI001A94268D|nr:hypothetical protein [Streptomyces laculatispora]MBO0918534.1 hypothetical protein [Streptomyces laculatispora]